MAVAVGQVGESLPGGSPAETSFLGQAGLLPSRMSWLLTRSPSEGSPGPCSGLPGCSPFLYYSIFIRETRFPVFDVTGAKFSLPKEFRPLVSFFVYVCVLDHNSVLNIKTPKQTVAHGKMQWVKVHTAKGPNSLSPNPTFLLYLPEMHYANVPLL